MSVVIRTAYQPSEPVRVVFPETEGRTQQSFKKQCDVNTIMKQFEKTGMFEHVTEHAGSYGDYLDAPEYHAAMNAVVEAQEMFDTLPARVRKRFGNDPSDFLAFMDDPENVDEMRSLGLLLPAEPAVVSPAEPAISEAPEGPVTSST